MKITPQFLVAFLAAQVLCCGGEDRESVGAIVQPLNGGGMIGFNYWPNDNYASKVLLQEFWTDQNKGRIRADLNSLASVGGGVVRLLLAPNNTGYWLKFRGGGGSFGDDYTFVRNTSLPEFMGYLVERNIKVIIAFDHAYMNKVINEPGNPFSKNIEDCETPTHYNRYWKCGYGDTDVGFEQLKADSWRWMQGIIDATKYSPSLLYYDISNEVMQGNAGDLIEGLPGPKTAQFLQYMYDFLTAEGIPAAKRGFSVNRAGAAHGDDIAWLRWDVLGGIPATRPVGWIEFHIYQDLPPTNLVEQGYDTVKLHFPDAAVVLGEVGYKCVTDSCEPSQKDWIYDLVLRARAKGFAYYLNWFLWDTYSSALGDVLRSEGRGWGYSPHRPKDVFGAVADLENAAFNADMETTTPISGVQTPTGWFAGGVPNWFYSVDDWSASGKNIARVHINDNTGELVHFYSDYVYVTGGCRFFPNAFIRSTLSEIKMAVTEYNSSFAMTQQTIGPSYDPPNLSFFNYQWFGPWFISLRSDTRYVRIGITGTTTTEEPDYLDVDVVSASCR